MGGIACSFPHRMIAYIIILLKLLLFLLLTIFQFYIFGYIYIYLCARAIAIAIALSVEDVTDNSIEVMYSFSHFLALQVIFTVFGHAC